MLTFRFPIEADAKLYFEWANDPDVRNNAHNKEPILWESHVKWFSKKLQSNSLMFVFFDGITPVGQIRIDHEFSIGYIDISVDRAFRGRGLGLIMLKAVTALIRKIKLNAVIAEIKQTNTPSIKVFKAAGFAYESDVTVNDVMCKRLSIRI